MLEEESENNPNVTKDVSRAGRSWGRVVMDTGSLDVRAVTLGRGIVQREGQPLGVTHDRLDRRENEESSDAVGLLAGRGDGGIARAELIAQPRGSDPTGDGPTASGEDRAEEQQDESWGRTAIESGNEIGEPLARSGVLM